MESVTVPQSELKELSARHKNVAALLAQGVDRATIAQAVDYTPEYVTMLQNQPLFKAYVKEMSAAAGVHMEALFSRSVEIVRDVMEVGSTEDRLKAAKLQMEATGRVGRFQVVNPGADGGDKLEILADRLVSLMKQRRVDNGQVSDAEILSESTGLRIVGGTG